jgi:hypothetical protein
MSSPRFSLVSRENFCPSGWLEELSLSYQVKAKSIFTKEQLERLPHGWAFEMGLGYEIPMMDGGRRSKKKLQ